MDTGTIAAQIESWAVAYAPLIAAVGLGLAAVSASTSISLDLSLRRVRRRYQQWMRGPTGQDLDAVLVEQAKQLQAATTALATLERRFEALENAALRHVQHVGVVRFSAFAGIGADLSFAIALMDGRRNGFVLSSLYGRDDLRAYAKPVVNGRSTYSLTGEEEQAIQLALRDAAAADSSPRRARTG